MTTKGNSAWDKLCALVAKQPDTAKCNTEHGLTQLSTGLAVMSLSAVPKILKTPNTSNFPNDSAEQQARFGIGYGVERDWDPGRNLQPQAPGREGGGGGGGGGHLWRHSLIWKYFAAVMVPWSCFLCNGLEWSQSSPTKHFAHWATRRDWSELWSRWPRRMRWEDRAK